MQSRDPVAEVQDDGVKAPASGHTGNFVSSQVAPALTRACESCGVIQTVREVFATGHSSGEVADGIGGAQVDSQLGRSHGSAALGVLGALGGAFAGNTVERNLRGRPRYHVSVLMEDGTRRTIYSAAPPAFAVGETVRVVDGTLMSAHG